MSSLAKLLRRVPYLLRKGRALIVVAFAALVLWLLQDERARQVPRLALLLDALQRLEHISHDLRFHWRGAQPSHPDIAVIGITKPRLEASSFRPEELRDSESLQLMTERDFPWRRKVHAALIEKLFAAGARTVVFDLVFASATEDDAELREMIAKYPGQIVLASTLQHNAGSAGNELMMLTPTPSLLPENADRLVGFAFHHPDADQVIRRVDYRTSELREHGLENEPDTMIGLSALAAEKFAGSRAPGGYRHPIDFQGPAGTYPILPVHELFVRSIYERDPRFGGGAAFRDKLVFVGPTFELAHDVHSTPFGVMNGVEVHAQIAGALLRGSRLRDAPASVTRGSTIGMLLATVLVVLFVRSAALQSALLLLLGAGFVITSHALFAGAEILLVNVPPLFALAVTGSFGVVFLFFVEQLERAHLRRVLDRYVSRNVASVVIANADEFEASLRGERKCATVLFSDVRGFTSIFETADAEQLVAQLNEYFHEMVDIVLREGGTLQKFIGDAIMAVWGDTHSRGREVDAAHAVRSALAMRSALAALNRGWSGHPARLQFQTGIGVNHGEVVVGNIGHPQRMEFTALGDAINLAARLESATKQFRCDILVGEGAESLTREEFVYRRVDRLRLVGKTQPVEVFIPLSEVAVTPPSWLAGYHHAVDRYRKRDFPEAAALFAQINAILGGDDFLCSMYERRCRDLAETPPPPDWDGAHSLKEK